MPDKPEEVTIDVLKFIRNIADTAVVNMERGKLATPQVPNIGGPGGPLDSLELEPMPWTQEELDSLEERVNEAITQQNRHTQAAETLLSVMEAIRHLLPGIAPLL